jgi:GTP-binding protein
MKNIIAIVGRPNVGKSTLFNRLTGKNEAIVHDSSGVTRDRNYGEGEWTGKKFFLIDTGGFVPHSDDKFEEAIRKQVKMAIEEADKILFVVDAQHGLHPIDKEVANMLRKYSNEKKIVLLTNKIDDIKQENFSAEFYKLGLGEPFPISAISGRNSGDLLDIVCEDIEEDVSEEDDRIKFAIIGRPNAGKSSIVNAIHNEDRNIVTDIPGTTRDSIDSVVKYHNEDILLIDTAGLRKKTKVSEDVEFYSTIRTYKAIKRCDVAILVIDVSLIIENLESASDYKLAVFKLDKQDTTIIEEVYKYKKGLLVVINKWDLLEKDSNTAQIIENKIREHLQSFDFLKFIFISAKTKQRIHKILEEGKKIYELRNSEIKTSELNEKLLPEIQKTPPASLRGKEIKINYITQVKTAPPVFAFFTNDDKGIQPNYRKFLERKIRSFWNFEGVPISLIFKKKN